MRKAKPGGRLRSTQSSIRYEERGKSQRGIVPLTVTLECGGVSLLNTILKIVKVFHMSKKVSFWIGRVTGFILVLNNILN